MKTAPPTRRKPAERLAPGPMDWLVVEDEPEQKGAIYCAKHCGRKCTLKEFEATMEAALKLKRQLGIGWTVRIWDNLGWHYQLELAEKRLTVHGDRHRGKTSYSAYLNWQAESGGSVWSASGPTPEAAIEAVLKIAMDQIDRHTLGINAVRLALEKVKADSK